MTAKAKHVKNQSEEMISLDKDKQNEFSKTVENIEPSDMKSGTMYIGHIPHGFYEEQISGYFSQFGTVNKVRLARSKKTGGYKGYGYVQFACEDVAKIAAEAMNNYLMFDKLLKCEYVSDDKLHPAVWKGSKKKFVWLDRRKMQRSIHNRVRSKENIKKLHDNFIKRDRAKRRKLVSLGIQYEFPGYETIIAKKPSAKKTKTPSKKKKVNVKK